MPSMHDLDKVLHDACHHKKKVTNGCLSTPGIVSGSFVRNRLFSTIFGLLWRHKRLRMTSFIIWNIDIMVTVTKTNIIRRLFAQATQFVNAYYWFNLSFYIVTTLRIWLIYDVSFLNLWAPKTNEFRFDDSYV